MIKNIVFDIGNVLVSFRPEDYVDTLISDKKTARSVIEAIFKSREWLMLDRGVMTEEEACREFCSRNLCLAENIRSVMKDWHQMLTPLDETVEILKKLKKSGYKVFYLSNYQVEAFDFINKYEFFKLFDGGILSCNVKLLKPEKEIYETLAQSYGLKPEETVFIDDTTENIEGAGEFGFGTIQFIGCDDLIKKLVEFDVHID